MNEMKVDWSDLYLFMSVAREGGLSAASKVTGRSAATLGRRMLALERSMERELFIRHDRGYEMTAEARKLLDDLQDVEARIVRSTLPPTSNARPLVKISAGAWTTLAMIENLDEITGKPADIRLRFMSAEQSLDITRREVVIGVRNARPTEEGLAGRRLSPVEFAPYATAAAPELWIRVVADTPSARWLAKTVGNDALCEVNSPRNSLDLALSGKGIALLPTFIGDQQRGLSRISSAIPELTHYQWIVTHQDDRHIPEVRRTIDRICRLLEAQG
ncbi:MAG: LysR family transcriptional regulator [Hyphomicrobiales bacterium]